MRIENPLLARSSGDFSFFGVNAQAIKNGEFKRLYMAGHHHKNGQGVALEVVDNDLHATKIRATCSFPIQSVFWFWQT